MRSADNNKDKMMQTRVRYGDWVIVCDGRKALFFQNEGDTEFPIFHAHEVMEHRLDANRDIESERPGRVQDVSTTARSSIEQVDHHELEERDFLAKVAKHIDQLVTSGKIHHLILVAPPRALGAIRKVYSPAVRAALRAEIDQDLVKVPVAEIQDKFAVRGEA